MSIILSVLKKHSASQIFFFLVPSASSSPIPPSTTATSFFLPSQRATQTKGQALLSLPSHSLVKVRSSFVTLSSPVRMRNSGGNKKSSSADSWEVDDLLQAAEDHLLLNLRTNSHSKSQIPFSSSSYLDSDLARRFDALISPPNPYHNPNPSKPPNQPQEKRIAAAAVEESSGMLGDDLAAKFAALKASSGRLPSAAANLGFEQKTDGGRIFEASDDDVGDTDGAEVSKKEMEELVQWTKDAARLDPSPKRDDDDDSHDDVESEDDSEEEGRKKRKGKSKPKPKRFIFSYPGFGCGNNKLLGIYN